MLELKRLYRVCGSFAPEPLLGRWPAAAVTAQTLAVLPRDCRSARRHSCADQLVHANEHKVRILIRAITIVLRKCFNL
jgi:hypothetical protein